MDGLTRSILCQTGISRHFVIFDIRTLWRSGPWNSGIKWTTGTAAVQRKMDSLEIFAFKKYCDLETRVKCYSRSLEMTPFDLCSLVSIWLKLATFWNIDFEKHCDLEVRVRGHSRLSKLVLFNSLPTVSYLRPIVTLSLKCTMLEIFVFENCQYLETRVSGHSWSLEINYTIR